MDTAWLVRVWLSNDSYTDAHARGLVEDAGNVYEGARLLKDWMEDEADLLTGGHAGLFTDIISGALREVDWEDVARAFTPEEWGGEDEAPEEGEDDE